MTTALQLIPPTALIIDEAYRIITPPDAIAYRDALLAETSRFQTVDYETAEIVKSYLATESRLRIGVEKTRVQIGKEPLKITRRINEDAAAFIDPVKADECRLRDMLARYEIEQEEKRQAAVREAARLRKEEEDRLAREWLAQKARDEAAAKAAVELEGARAAAEKALAGPVVDIDDEIAQAAAIDAANEARAAKAQIDAENALAAQQARATAATAEAEVRKLETAPAPKASFFWDFEPTNARAFAQWCWDNYAKGFDCLVSIDLNRNEILKTLKEFPIDAAPPIIPGLSVVKRARVR